MIDEELRDLERRASEGDAFAQEALARAWTRLGRGWRGEALPPSITPARKRPQYLWHAGTDRETLLEGDGDEWRWDLEPYRTWLFPVEGEGLVARVRSPGGVDESTAADVDRTVHELRRRSIRWIVIDASDLDAVSQAGIEMAMRHGIQLRASGGGVPILGLPERWRLPFDFLNLGIVLDLVETLDEARELITRSLRTGRAPEPWRPPPSVAAWIERRLGGPPE